MKNLIFTLALMVMSTVTNANEVAPQMLKGGTVTVTLKDGRTYKFSSDRYMVAERAPVGPRLERRKVYVFDRYQNKNTLKLFGGAGPTGGLSVATGPSSVTVSPEYGVVYGIGYSRDLTKDWSVEVIGLSNYTGLLGLGWHW